MILNILLSVIYFGCNSPPEENQSPAVGRPSAAVGDTDVLSELISQKIKTSGTFNEDYKEAEKYLKSADTTLLAQFPISPVKHLISGYDTAYRRSRREWLKQRLHFYPPIILSKYMLFCRFIRNAAHVNSRECQYQSIRDANQAMLDLRRPKVLDYRNHSQFEQFNTLLRLCVKLRLSTDCPAYALEGSLAIDAIRMERPSHATESKAILHLVMEMLIEIRNLWTQCPDERDTYKAYVTAIIDTAKQVLLPPPEPGCMDELVPKTVKKINEIDTKYRTIMEC